MGCSNFVKVYNNSKFISLAHRPKIVNYCECGHCEYCVQKKRLEWSIRSQYEARYTAQNTGWIYYDTLTYSEKCVPWLSLFHKEFSLSPADMYCFDHSHIRKFIVLLREWLSRDGYDVKGHLKFFIAGEYGMDPSRTMRPHYHVLFFVTFPIDYIIFSRYVALAWPYGHTDGYLWKNEDYIINHNVIPADYSMKVVSYVTKYVMKPIEYANKLRRHLDQLFSTTLYYCKDWKLMKSARAEYDKIFSLAMPYHTASKHFGECAFEMCDLLDDMKIDVITDGQQHKVVVAPRYYYRKRMYESYNEGAVRRQRHSSFYYEFQRRRFDRKFKMEAQRLELLYKSLSSSSFYDIKDEVDSYDIPFDRLVDYSLYQRNRYIIGNSLKPYDCIDQNSERLDHLKEFGFPLLYSYMTQRDKEYYGFRHYSRIRHPDPLVDDLQPPDLHCDNPRYVFDALSPSELESMCYKDSLCERVMEIYDLLEKYYSTLKNDEMRRKRILRDKMKNV